jgi:hypothetical protein
MNMFIKNKLLADGISIYLLPFIDILIDIIGCCHCAKREQASRSLN